MTAVRAQAPRTPPRFVIRISRFSRAFGVATWGLVIVLALGALANLASSSPWERFGWAPFTVLLTVATFIVARGRNQNHAELRDATIGSGT